MLTCKSPRKVMLAAHHLARHPSRTTRASSAATTSRCRSCSPAWSSRSRWGAATAGPRRCCATATTGCRAIGMRRAPTTTRCAAPPAFLLTPVPRRPAAGRGRRWAALAPHPRALDQAAGRRQHVLRERTTSAATTSGGAARRAGGSGRKRPGNTAEQHAVRHGQALPKLASASRRAAT